MNEIRKALHDILSGDDDLAKLAIGGVHKNLAPPGTETPYIIISRPAETNLRTFDGPTLDKDVWVVKGVSNVTAEAEDIAEAVRKILDGASLVITGRDTKDVHRISGFDYTETVEGERFDHVGHEYKIDTEEEEE
jgi:hypothetical protein